MLEAQPFDPSTIPGLLEPKAPEKKTRKRDQSRIDVSEGGSMTMRRLFEKNQEKQQEAKRLEAIAQDKRDEKAKCVGHASRRCRTPPTCTPPTTPRPHDHPQSDPRGFLTRCRKKREREDEEHTLLAAWELCGTRCACDLGDLCPVKGMKRCEFCGDIKKRVCGKRACIEKAAPLRLTYNGEAAA